MKLEVGRTYKTRNGDKVTLGSTAVEGCVGFGEPLGLYLPDGKFGYMEDGLHVSQSHDLDIISEWTDEPHMVLENGSTITFSGSSDDAPIRSFTSHEFDVYPMGVQDIEPVTVGGRASTTLSTVRTVTRKEIVPGAYGPLNVIANIGGLVSMQVAKEFLTKGEVDELLSHLTAIKEAME